MNSSTPLLVAMDVSRFSAFTFLVIFASSIAMVSVFLALMPGISRIYVALSRDKILPQSFSKIHNKFNSAYFSEAFVLISVIIGIYIFDVVKDHKSPIISESGIKNENDAKYIYDRTGIKNFLIGESLLSSDNPAALIKKIIQINQ